MNRTACHRCSHPEFTTKRRVAADGHIQIVRKCNKCDELWQPEFVKKADVDVDALEWDEPMPVTYCEHCGQPYAQYHHFMPQSIARRIGENPDSWPTQNLCSKCHGLWHESVTPGLVKKEW